ncbi:MAG: hypothetical protein QXV32_08890 [Conexivisphaerales archaeon]
MNIAIELITATATYGTVINVALLFVDGVLFGLAAKKALTSLILLVIALILAGYLGLSIPFLTPSSVVSHAGQIASSIYHQIGPAFFAYPIVFIAGFAIAFWKG